MTRLVLILLLVWVAPVWAVQPDEVLDDPVLEDRAREISAGLRCPVCRNESIDESNAEIARDLRLLVRERLVAGDSDAAVIAHIVERYGEFVLLNPPARGSTWILFLSIPALALAGATLAVAFLRQRARAAEPAAALSTEEKARLDELMRK
ncbi:MAG: cytochrome c-type biogenesis protein [Pseudomonadota bacterium]